MARLCYKVTQASGRWSVLTAAPWPNALATDFDSLTEALTVATIAARVEWEQNKRSTCVCVRDATGLRLQQAFG
jgi:hypothetical protein